MEIKIANKGVITINIIKFYAKMLLPVLLEAGELYFVVWLLSKVWRSDFSFAVQIGISVFCLFWTTIRMINVYKSVKNTWNGVPWWLAGR